MLWYIFLVLHTIACGYVAVSRWVGAGATGFVMQASDTDGGPARQYLVALYWSFARCDDAEPATMLERAFHAAAVLAKELSAVTIVGQVASIISNMDSAAAQFRERLQRAEEFMSTKQLPERMRQRIREYYAFLWDRDRGVRANEEDVGRTHDHFPARLSNGLVRRFWAT